MRSFTIKTSEFDELLIEYSGSFQEIYMTVSFDDNCIRFSVDKIDEVVGALLKLKEEVN